MIRNLLVTQKDNKKIAIVEQDNEISYSNIMKKAFGIQSLLLNSKQEKVAIFLPNGSDYIAAFWGIISLGITVFPLNILLTCQEIISLLKQTGTKTLITINSYQKLFEEIIMQDRFPLQILYIDTINTYQITTNQNILKVADINPNDTMVLLCTSGTIGNSKIVQLSEKNVATTAQGYLNKIHIHASNSNKITYILNVPFSSVYGLMILSACLMKSFPIVVMPPAFTLNALYTAVEKHHVTHYEGSTTALILMEQMAGRNIPYNIQSLTCCGFGGSKIAGSTIATLQKSYPWLSFYQGYGMTESAALITKHPYWNKLEKPESVGNAIEGVEIAIETENGITHTSQEVGEIIVKGPNVMLGYYNNEVETNQILKNGYLYTGDIGYLDEEGYLYICGRKKNIIIIRGFNVYPEEIESCILSSTLAKDCYVYGKIDIYGDEIVCAEIVPANTQVQAEELKSYCNRYLAEYKQPKELIFCESIGKNSSGKTQRKRGTNV